MLEATKEGQAFWQQMAAEVETEKAALQQRLTTKQVAAAVLPPRAVSSWVQASTVAATKLHLDEAETRLLIDDQLRLAGWTVDSENLRYAKGSRPQKGKNLAIAEWPTATGPADYVLFVGLVPMAAVEAKRKNVNVSAALIQAKRYSRGFQSSDETRPHAQKWGKEQDYRLPFVFSSNGRPFLRQLATHSGIWFCDPRRPDNLSDVLQGWLTPEGLTALLKRDEAAAHQALATENFDYHFGIRSYQRDAVLATEKAIADFGKRAQNSQLKLEDLQGGNFTISNGGVFGSLMSTPILNTPQSGVLGLHRIEDRPVVRDGQIVIRPMMYLALSYDHRVVDGKEAVTFLVRIKDCIENPARLLVGA